MTPSPLDDRTIELLASELAAFSAHDAPELFFDHEKQFRLALLSHRKACSPTKVAAQILYATLTGRPLKIFRLISSQRALLRIAADEASYVEDVYAALREFENERIRFSLGPNASYRQKLGWMACDSPQLLTRYEALVRNGEVADASTGLQLHRAERRRLAAYLVCALIIGWQWLIFLIMAFMGDIQLGELTVYMAGAVLFAIWLTRGVFTAIRTDRRTIEQVNQGLAPKRLVGKSRGW